MTREIDLRLTDSSLTDAQWIPLWLIRTGQCRTASEISRLANLNLGAVTRMITRIEDRGLLVRVRSVEDRRVVYLHLTEAGRAVTAKVPEVLADVLNLYLAGFDREEWQTLLSLLKRLRANGGR